MVNASIKDFFFFLGGGGYNINYSVENYSIGYVQHLEKL